MSNKEKAVKKHREPLIHITRRSNVSTTRAILVRVIAILASFICMAAVISVLMFWSNGKLDELTALMKAQNQPTSAIIAALANAVLDLIIKNPWTLIKAMFEGTFGTGLRTWVLFSDTAILLGVALALTPAFKMKFWNCGGEGQVMIGSLATAALMYFTGNRIPLPLLILLSITTSVLIGAIWGLIPAVFKAKWNTNETLFTLMMNYIALQCVTFFLKLFGDSQGNLPPMPEFAMPKILGGPYFLNIVLILAICVIMFIYLRYSKQGYEISVVGESEKTAKYVGISVPKVIIRTMILSGALCGLIGFLLVANGSCSVTTTITGGRGFTAILVSWLGKFNPLVMILTSFLVIFLQKGTSYMGEVYRLDTSLADVFIGVVLLVIIGCEFFINYKINIRKSNKEGK